MTHGIKSLAQDLAKHGRYGDTMVAHINPQEAALLKAMGGSGTINPVTGLPEYWGGLGALNPVKAISNAWGGVKNVIPGGNLIDKGLVGIDKAVGSAIPGGWGTLGMVAASMVPGVTPMMMAGLGALNGSGVARGGKFNLQGALMGGAMAYGMSSLAQGLQAAGSSIPAGDIVAANAAPDAISALNTSQAWTGPGAEALTQGATQAAGQTANNFAYTPSGEMVPSNVSADITGASSPVVPPAPTPSALQNLATGYGENVAATGRGIANLTGLGPTTSEAARAAFTGSGATLQNTALPMLVGGTGLMSLKEQEDALNQANAAGTVNQADYNTQMARINDAKARASQAVSENPYQFAKGGEVKGYFGGGIMQAISNKIQNDPSFLAKMQEAQSAPASTSSSGGGFGSGILRQLANNPSFIERLKNIPSAQTPQSLAEQALNENPYQFAMGGTVNPPDDQTGMENHSPMQNLDQGGVASMIGRTAPQQMYAAGGMAAGRFLSGQGDGLSDDIPAIIGNKQPAKLADGEFVVSSDVVSGLGGGSSKAGAKKLYAMMDRVRKQAHGTKKQIRPVSTKALPA